MIYTSRLTSYFIYICLRSFLSSHLLNYTSCIHSISTSKFFILLSYIVMSYILKIMRIMCRSLFLSCSPIKWCFTYCAKHVITSLYLIYITMTFWTLLTFFHYLLRRYYILFFTLMNKTFLLLFITFPTHFCFTYYTSYLLFTFFLYFYISFAFILRTCYVVVLSFPTLSFLCPTLFFPYLFF